MKSFSRSCTLRSFTLLLAAVPSLALFAIAVAACGDDADNVALPIFEGGPTLANEADGGEASTAEGGDGATPTDGQTSDTSTSDAPTGDGATAATNLVISQVQSRGTAGGNDELIEIYNPTAASITFDNTWTITDRNANSGLGSCTTAATTLYTGTGQAIASHKHLLIATSVYSEAAMAAADDSFSAGISDAASIVLLHSSATVDALCFSYDATTTTTLTTCSTAYTCEGTPATNPHNDTTTGVSASDVSLERKPGGSGGNGIDTNVNANDFQTASPADPHDLASAAAP